MRTRCSSRLLSRGSRPYSAIRALAARAATSQSATNRSRCGPDCKASSISCRSARGDPYWTSWMRSPASQAPVPCIDAIHSCGQAALDVGPGEDLEYSLRLRRLGYLIRFVPEAWAETDGPTSGISLLRQRARWDRDALRIRFMTYGELSFFHRLERFPDTLQRLDFIVFDLIPTLSLPFYLVYIVLLFGTADAALFLVSIYVLLLWISIFNMALAFVMFNRSIGLFGLGAALIFPMYQGVYLKCARFFSYSSEIIFASSRRDDFVPPRVRRALLADRI